MPFRVLTAMLLLGLAAATAHEVAERQDAPSVCFMPLDKSEAPRCALPPAKAEGAF